MKKRLIALALIIFLFSSCSSKSDMVNKTVIEFPRSYSVKYNKTEKYEKRAVWFSYLDYEKTLEGLDEKSFSDKITSMFSEIKSFGFNTVIFQVRSHSDAIYSSKLYPASSLVSSELGGSIYYDSLKIAVNTAHEQGLKIEAWINPLRAHSEEEAENLSFDCAFKEWYDDENKKGNNIVLCSGRWYYNPSVKEVRDFIASGVREICQNYDVDAIHIDDYFYPTTETYFDEIAFSNQTEFSSLDEFRKSSVSEMVKSIYSSVKEVNKDVEFGVSPQGNISNCVNKCYADVKLWCEQSGYIDYIAPQLYYSFKQIYMPFDKALEEWQQIKFSDSVDFYVGLAAYKLCGRYTYSTEEERLDWSQSRDMLSRQVSLSRNQKVYNGFMAFSYSHLFLENDEEINKEKEQLKTLL